MAIDDDRVAVDREGGRSDFDLSARVWRCRLGRVDRRDAEYAETQLDFLVVNLRNGLQLSSLLFRRGIT